MNLSHMVQLKPTKPQEAFLRKAVGVSRFTYNWALSEWTKQYEKGEKPTANKLKKQFNSIKEQQFPWVYESPKDANQQPFANLQTAFNNFFSKKSKYPQFKKKHSNDSFYLSNDKFSVTNQQVRLPLIGKIKTEETLRFDGKIMSATISRKADKWFISINVDVGVYQRKQHNSY